MLASRRCQPIPQDFLLALNSHQLTLRSLIPHLNPPVLPEKTQPTLGAGPTSSGDDPAQAQLIDTIVGDVSVRSALASYVPKSLPPLPSQHTYKAEAVFSRRQYDPKKVRELATEEGRMGEEALRRFVEQASSAKTLSPSQVTQASAKKTSRRRNNDLWKETMEAVSETQRFGTGSQPLGSRELPERLARFGSAVNADRVHWRKPVAPKNTF